MQKTLKVLIVEDSESDALLLVLALEQADYIVISERIETAQELHRALDTQIWDVVLADYSLPQFTAIDALKIVQEKQLDMPFIIVRTYALPTKNPVVGRFLGARSAPKNRPTA